MFADGTTYQAVSPFAVIEADASSLDEGPTPEDERNVTRERRAKERRSSVLPCGEKFKKLTRCSQPEIGSEN